MKVRQLFALFCVCFLGWSASLSAQTDAQEKGLLWAISGPDQATTSYLFGTIHMIPAKDYALSDAARKALASSERIAFEIDMEEMQNPANLFGMMDKLFMANDTSLADLLTPEEYKEVESHFSELGLPFAFLTKMKPMFLSVMADVDMQGFGQEDSEIKSYEIELSKLAEEQKKDIFGLETMAFQMSLFDAIPYRSQAEMLLAAIRSEDEEAGEGQFDRMVELYKTENIHDMANMMQDEDSGMDSNMEEMLLLKRNRSWIPLMATAMQEKTVFFAVGAGHLGGPEGVVALLRKAGYTVKRVKQ